MSGKLISPRTVFVLDVSGSMWGMKCETLQLSVTRSIEEIPEGSYVGIVLFDDEVWIEQEVIQITDRSIRDRLIAKVPQMARGSTDIGSGLLKALDALTQKEISTEDANIILITDGQDTTGSNYVNRVLPTLLAAKAIDDYDDNDDNDYDDNDNDNDDDDYDDDNYVDRFLPTPLVAKGSVSGWNDNYVDRVLPTLLAAKVRISCIAIGNSADPNLERLARETSGNVNIASDTNREMAARVIESAIQEVKTSTEMCEVSNISVCNDLISISHKSIAFEVIIDSDIGQNTLFTVWSEDVDKFSVTIASPNGKKYDMTCNEFNKNESLKRYQLKLRSAESGVWTIHFVRHSNQTLSASISVTSQPLNSKAIQMRVILKDADINTETPPIIIAEIRKGSDTVMGAEVMATIDKPNGTQSHIKLNNDDNNYMNYFTDYCGSGRYNVSVLAKSGSNVCQLKSISSGNNVSEIIPVPRFQRQCIVGCFKVENFMPSNPSDSYTLQELPIREALDSLSLISSSSDLPVEVSVPQYSGSNERQMTAKKVIQKTDILWVPYLATRKLIKSSEMPENEKTILEDTIEEIFVFISSPKLATIEEIQSKRKILDEIKAKLSI